MKTILLISSIVILCVSCKQKPQQTGFTPEQMNIIRERSIEAHRALVRKNNDSIQNYIVEHNLNMQRTGTGLWYAVYESGSADSIIEGDIIEIAYRVSLMGDGVLLYSSDSTGNLILKVGQGGVESGLEEAFLMMSPGDSARLLIPPHLAHGLIGDLKRIPWLAILEYHVHIVNHRRDSQ